MVGYFLTKLQFGIIFAICLITYFDGEMKPQRDLRPFVTVKQNAVSKLEILPVTIDNKIFKEWCEVSYNNSWQSTGTPSPQNYKTVLYRVNPITGARTKISESNPYVVHSNSGTTASTSKSEITIKPFENIGMEKGVSGKIKIEYLDGSTQVDGWFFGKSNQHIYDCIFVVCLSFPVCIIFNKYRIWKKKNGIE